MSVESQLSKALWKVVLFMESEMKKIVPTDTGEHKQSIEGYIKGLEGGVRSDTRQSVIAEFGRKRGKAPPFDALVGWVIRKFKLPGRKTGRYEQLPIETRRAVRNVALAIQRRGIPAKHLYTNTVKKNITKIQSIFKNSL